jgi:AcrR family transcriptional regulator
MAPVRTRRTQEQRSAETRTKLLDATIELLTEVGYAGTTTRLVAARAGVSGGAQTHHFPRRADLVGAAIERLAEQRADGLRAASADLPEQGSERAAAMLDLIWADFSSPIFAIGVKLWIAADDDPELYERMTAFERLMARMLAQLTRDLAADLPGVPDLEARIQTVMAAVRGLALTERFEPRRRPKRADAPDSWEQIRPILERVLTQS